MVIRFIRFSGGVKAFPGGVGRRVWVSKPRPAFHVMSLLFYLEEIRVLKADANFCVIAYVSMG